MFPKNPRTLPFLQAARPWLLLTVGGLALLVSAYAFEAPAQEDSDFSELRFLIEINATDGDAGFQAKIDADGWKEVNLYNPAEERLYQVKGERAVKEQGLTENFFESAEPSCDEVPLDVVLERFPEGFYDVERRSIENEKIEGESLLTHNLPGAPENLAPGPDLAVDAGFPVMISWTAGDSLGNCPDLMNLATILSDEAQLFGYQLVIGREDPGPALNVVIELEALPAGPKQATIPAEFLEPGAIYKYEVVAIENRDGARGNQTISESFFCTLPLEGDCELPE
jgi:hypothetical protein